MGKIIKMSDSDIEQAVTEFREALHQSPKIIEGKIGYTKTFTKNERKATLHFTEMANLKMMQLVDKFDKEIAWHGVAFRDDNLENDDYYITDILVYPQEVTGATVTTDQTKYQSWLYEHDDDVFNNIRFQGHSHVRMGVTPSGTDESLYERLLGMCRDDDFYIFGIWNKNNARNIAIYDMKKNLAFDNSEITVVIDDDGTGINAFVQDARKMVTERTYTAQGNGYYSRYSGQSLYDSAYKGNNPPAETKPATPVTPAPATSNGSTASKKKKRKRVAPEVARIALYGGKYDDYDEDSNPYSAFGHT